MTYNDNTSSGGQVNSGVFRKYRRPEAAFVADYLWKRAAETTPEPLGCDDFASYSLFGDHGAGPRGGNIPDWRLGGLCRGIGV